MLFDMRDRFVLLNILPPEGDFTTIKIVHDLKQGLAPSEKEIKEYNIRTNEGQILWDDAVEKKNKPKEVAIGEKAFEMIKEQFKMLSEKKKLTEGHIETFIRFCGDENEVK